MKIMSRKELHRNLNYVLNNDLSVRKWKNEYTKLFNDCEKKMIFAENMQEELLTRFGKNSFEDIYDEVEEDIKGLIKIENLAKSEEGVLVFLDIDRFEISDTFHYNIENADHMSILQMKNAYKELSIKCAFQTVENSFAEFRIQKAYGDAVYSDIKANSERAYEEIQQMRSQNEERFDYSLLSGSELYNKIESVMSSAPKLTLDGWKQVYTELADDCKRRIMMDESVEMAIKEMYGQDALLSVLSIAAKDYINKMNPNKREEITPEQAQTLADIFGDR